MYPTSNSNTNNVLVSRTMTLDMRDYVLAHLGRRPDPPEHLAEWVPPPFGDVYDYCRTLCFEGRAVIPFGKYDNNFMKLFASGRVECWDADSDSFRDEGILTVSYSQGTFEHVRVVVLGSIAGTGTGVLLDTDGNVWLYNPEHAVDGFVSGTKPRQTAIILKAGSSMNKTTPWDVVGTFEDAKIVFDPDSESSEKES